METNNQIKNINAMVYMELRIRNEELATIEVVTEFDGATYRSMHVSGPRFDVEDYFEGRLDMNALQNKWSK